MPIKQDSFPKPQSPLYQSLNLGEFAPPCSSHKILLLPPGKKKKGPNSAVPGGKRSHIQGQIPNRPNPTSQSMCSSGGQDSFSHTHAQSQTFNPPTPYTGIGTQLEYHSEGKSPNGGDTHPLGKAS